MDGRLVDTCTLWTLTSSELRRLLWEALKQRRLVLDVMHTRLASVRLTAAGMASEVNGASAAPAAKAPMMPPTQRSSTGGAAGTLQLRSRTTDAVLDLVSSVREKQREHDDVLAVMKAALSRLEASVAVLSSSITTVPAMPSSGVVDTHSGGLLPATQPPAGGNPTDRTTVDG